LNLIAKTASPGPGVPVPTLESWIFFEFPTRKLILFYLFTKVQKMYVMSGSEVFPRNKGKLLIGVFYMFPIFCYRCAICFLYVSYMFL